MYINEKNDINRFRREQDRDYETALREISEGKKRGHWIWYIFPQLRGLGQSSNSDYYGIRDLEEARAYLSDPTYSHRLYEITRALLDLEPENPRKIFDFINAPKVCSCMTLFEAAEGVDDSIFGKVLEKFYGGYRDQLTIKMIETRKKYRNI